MSETQNRRRNFRLFEFLVSRFTDAELRTMAECVQDELDFREERFEREPAPEVHEERKLRAPHRNHSVERAPEEQRRHPSGIRQRATERKAAASG